MRAGEIKLHDLLFLMEKQSNFSQSEEEQGRFLTSWKRGSGELLQLLCRYASTVIGKKKFHNVGNGGTVDHIGRGAFSVLS